MATTTRPAFASVDLNSVFEGAASQFRGLNPNQPGQWPLLPKLASWLTVVLLMLVLGWFLLLSSANDDLEAERAREPALKQDFRVKVAQAVNLDALRTQKSQVQEYVSQLEKQLPGRAEVDKLLTDINQAGIGRGLQFELFRPGQVIVKDYYAELPIAIRVSGRYHDIGSFAADIASLSRIVTLNNMNLASANRDSSSSGGALAMEATARTYRYLDQGEIDDMKKSAAAAKAGAKK